MPLPGPGVGSHGRVVVQSRPNCRTGRTELGVTEVWTIWKAIMAALQPVLIPDGLCLVDGLREPAHLRCRVPLSAGRYRIPGDGMVHIGSPAMGWSG